MSGRLRAFFFVTLSFLGGPAAAIEVMLPREGVVGAPHQLDWYIADSLPTDNERLDLVVVTLPNSVRLTGEDFYVYPPGEALFLGTSFEQDKFRLVYPVYLLNEMNGRGLDVRFYQTGTHRVVVSHVTVDRGGGVPTVRARREIDVAISDARPRLIVSDIARSDAAPRDRVLSPDGRTRLIVFDDDFELRDAATDLTLMRLAGTQPAYSPTGRFVMFNTPSPGQGGSDSYIADVQALEVAQLAHGTVHGWARGDALIVVARGDAMPGIRVADTFVNRHLRENEVPDEFTPSRLDIDRRLPLRSFDLFACMACDNQDIWFRLVPEFGIVAFSAIRDHAEATTRPGDEINAVPLLSGHYFSGGDVAPGGMNWQQGNPPEFVPQSFAIARGWNPGARLTAPNSARPAARPAGTLARQGETVGRVVRGLPVGGETERRTLEDQLHFAFGVTVAAYDTEAGAPPSASERQRLATAAKTGAEPFEPPQHLCTTPGDAACESPFSPSSWFQRLPDGRLFVVDFPEMGGGATGRIMSGEIWLGIVRAGRATAKRLESVATPALAQDYNAQMFGERKLVITSRDTDTVFVVDAASEQVTRIPALDAWNAARFAPLADRPILTQVNHDGALYFYSIDAGTLVLRGQFLDDELVLFTEDGRFDATGDGAHHVRLLYPGRREHHSFAQFRPVLHDPKAIAEALKGRAPPASAAVPIPPGLDLRATGSTLRVTAQGDAALKSVSFYIDGIKVAERQVQGRQARLEERLAVPAGGHWVTAVAADRRGLLSAAKTAFLSVPAAGAPPPGALHVLSIGINRYPAAPVLGDLAAAVPDAVALAEAMRRGGGRQYRAVNAAVLADAEATGEGIRRAVAALVDGAASGDTILLFVAGHGIRDQGDSFHLVAHDTEYRTNDAVGGRRLAQTSVPWKAIADLLSKSRARILVLLDACHSGTAGPNALAANDFAVRALREAATPGLLILASAKGRQLAQERPLPGGGSRGLFAYAVERALGAERAQADLDGNGVIEASELYRFVKLRVWQETQGLQTPWLTTSSIQGEVALF